MKYKILKITTFSLFFSGIFFSCVKEEGIPEKNRLIKALNYSTSASTKATDGIEYAYDNTGNMVKESFYDYNPTTGGLYMYHEYEYSGGKKVKMNMYNEKDKILRLNWYVDYFYEGEQLIKEEYRKADGFFSNSINYEYKNGNLIREYRYEPEKGVSDEINYSYDNFNRIILKEIATIDIKDSKYTKYIYDNNEREIKVEYYNLDWVLIQSIEKIYNGRSKLPVKDLHYDKDGVQTLQYQHYYDKKGNLTETRLDDHCSLFKRKYNGGLLMEEILYFDPVKDKNCLEKGMTRYEYQKL